MKFKQSLIENDSILLNASAEDWQSAIKLGTDMLEKTGAITANYYQAIIKAVDTLGPYIILAPNLAMPHARPEDGVNCTAFALVTLKTPVYFPSEDDPVDVLITLAGSSSDEHIAILQEVTQVLDDESSETGINLDRIRTCKNKYDIYQVIDESLK
ncbi:PTS sugar transporter subunit IIA [Thorsellia anophelis]|uniref:Ascorbate-specific PTS system EIIA component n=1 Tax=Thorsellia anophelis DSM 18579 TaxID=1123402 RepID=A0A1I0B9F7_9GAMM|nr:PTS sugar transporter subunit IIA [Thorsellia anophelis]SET03056.1 PTS system ascorbate-specific IIA component, L-Asc family (TC 4.A.7.1.1) [Thorsellia anophelis DSM 18579]